MSLTAQTNPGQTKQAQGGNRLVLGGGMIAALAAMIALPQFVYPILLMKIMCFAIFAMGYNMLLGQVGLLSFGHAMFFGGAGYVSAIAAKDWGLGPELALPLSVLFAAGLGGAIGFVSLRRSGIYFAMITLALAQMFYFLCLRLPFTHGEDGIQAVPRLPLFGLFEMDDIGLYALCAVLFAAVFAFTWYLYHAPFGVALRAVRENEQRAISLGYDVNRYRLVAFVISASITGLAGALKAIVFQLASLGDVAWTTSGTAALMTLIGGVGTLAGPVAGAVVLVMMQSLLSGFADWVLILQGAVFALVVLFFRRGIVGSFAELRRRQRSPNQPPSTENA